AGAMAEVDDAAEVRHRRQRPVRHLVVEGGHPDLCRVAEARRHAEVETRNLGRHRAAPEIGVLDLAEQGKGHQSITSEFLEGTAGSPSWLALELGLSACPATASCRA